jgi:hypothetical protein
MARTSPVKTVDERGLLLPLVSAQDFDAPAIAPTGVMQGTYDLGGTISSTWFEEARRAFKVFSSYG